MSGPALLLDTCAAIWMVGGDALSREATQALNESYASGIPVCISPISAWEVGLLASRGRLTLALTPAAWFRRLLSIDGIRVEDLSIDALIASSFLPGSPPRDPADRMIIATARETGLTIVTRDRLILDYARQGFVTAIAC